MIQSISTFLKRLLPLLPVGIASGEIIINEIMFHPGHAGAAENTGEEFIELYNQGNQTVSLDGWKFDRGVSYAFESVVIAPESYLVVAGDSAQFAERYGEGLPVVGGWTGRLSNSSEKIRLVNEAGETMDEVEYADDGDWAVRRLGSEDRGERGWEWVNPADGMGSSLELVSYVLSNEHGQNWAFSDPGGSPGTQNTQQLEKPAPLILDVGHQPAVPRPEEPAWVTARIVGWEGGAPTPELFHRISDNDPGPFVSVPMLDDGENRDGVADDGVFGARVPTADAGTVIEFYIKTASDSHRRTWPGPSDGQGNQEANALFQFDSEKAEGDQPVYRVIMSQREAERFAPGNFNSQSNAQMNATFIVTGMGRDPVIRYRAGIRHRGNSSRGRTPRSYRINLTDERPWNNERSLNLNSNNSHRQGLGMHLFQNAGLPAPDTRFVQLRLNTVNHATTNFGRHFGSYVHMTPIGSDFIEDQFPMDSSGNAYSKRSANPSRDRKRWGVHFGDQIVYNNENWYITDRWRKLTNESDNDWSDLQSFIVTMNEAPDHEYLQEMEETVHLDQWLRWFALMTMLNNLETNLSNGIDDDYAIYMGAIDRRVSLLPHDLDTIVGGDPGLSIFPMIETQVGAGSSTIPQLVRFFEHPEIRRRYFLALEEMINGVLRPDRFDPLVDDLLAHVSAEERDRIKNFNRERRSFVSNRIRPGLVADRDGFFESGGYPATSEATVFLSGAYSILDVDRVTVNGVDAQLDPVAGTWTVSDLPLTPGINRMFIEAYDGKDNQLETGSIDIWRMETGQTLPDNIASDTTLTSVDGPYIVEGETVVAPGAKLTIEPGTTLFFEKNARLRIQGVLRAEGTAYNRIQFAADPSQDFESDFHASLPQSLPKWQGVVFDQTMSEENVVTNADFNHAQHSQGSIGVLQSEVEIRRVTFAGTHFRMIYASGASLGIYNCVFPDMFAENESPLELGRDNNSEHIKSVGRIADGRFIVIQGNWFGRNAGHNDNIDADSGSFPDGVIQILDNTFTGTGDELFDGGGDAYVAGNYFFGVAKDMATSDRGYANAISAGDSSGNSTTVAVRNIFTDIDHAITVKRGDQVVFENNTVYNVHPDFFDRFNNPNVAGAINLFVDEAGGQPGHGAVARNNIFENAQRVFSNADLPNNTVHELIAEFNLIGGQVDLAVGERGETADQLGPGNLKALAGFRDPDGGDFVLAEDSPARSSGSEGQDRGAGVVESIFIGGAPDSPTNATNVELAVGGPGMFAYRYRVDGGDWSNDFPLGAALHGEAARTAPINLLNLSPGEHTVEALGMNFAGVWQTAPAATATWTVDPGVSPQTGGLHLSEIYAANTTHEVDGGFPDMIEIGNDSTEAINVGGFTLTDDPDDPGKFSIPGGTMIAPGERLVFYSGTEQGPGFSLSSRGETIQLVKPDGVTVEDEVAYGLQAPGFSVARTHSTDPEWRLAEPTPGAPNQPAVLGSAHSLKINEWLSRPVSAFRSDFAEIYNPNGLPVALGGLYLSDEPNNDLLKERVHPLSFAAPNGFAVLRLNNDNGGDEIGFRLTGGRDWLALSGPEGLIDRVVVKPQLPDHSTGRTPDGSTMLAGFELPSPGLPNGTVRDVELATLVDWESQWRFDDTNTDHFDSDWTASEFNDTGWPEGLAAFFVEEDDLAVAKNTALNLNPPTTHYFRHQFHFDGDTTGARIALTAMVDDGAVVYLNGGELRRFRVSDGPVAHVTFANDGASNATAEGPFWFEASRLNQGTNTLAAVVFQDDNRSSDVVFAARLDLETPLTSGRDEDSYLRLMSALRISEVMYHPPMNDDLEYIELQNISDEPLELEGVRLENAVEFVFPQFTLAPGAFVIVASNQDAFTAEYGDQIQVAGSYLGKLANGDERIELLLPTPYDAAILQFTYRDHWFPASDGGGGSIGFANVLEFPETWNDPSFWRLEATGSPGRGGPPLIISATGASGIIDDEFSYEIKALNFPTTYEATSLPAGLVFDPQTHIISGTLQEAGEFSVRLKVTNDSGTDKKTLHLNVKSSGPLDSLVWLPVAGDFTAGHSKSVRIAALDAKGRAVIGHQSEVTITALENSSNTSVFITEAGDRRPDFFEIQNLGSEPVDTTGWSVLTNDAIDSDISHVHGVGEREGTVWALPDSLDPFQIVYATDDEGEEFSGGNIWWNHNASLVESNRQKGWVMLLDADQHPVDYVVWGYPQSEIDSMSFLRNGRVISASEIWSGPGIPYDEDENLTIQRSGGTVTHTNSDWVWQFDSRGFANPGLEGDVGGNQIEAVVENGVWDNGYYTVDITIPVAGNIALKFEDDLGNKDQTNVEVKPAGPPIITSPGRITAVQSQEFQYQIRATNFPTGFGLSNAPDNWSIDSSTGLVTGIVSAPQDVNVTISASNALESTTAQLVVRVVADGDSDGMPDTWETENDFNPADAADAMLDNDTDGFTNLAEYRAGTDPRDITSFFAIQTAVLANRQHVSLTWNAVPGRTYEVNKSLSGEPGTWTPVSDPIKATSASESLVTPLDSRRPTLYRVSVFNAP